MTVNAYRLSTLLLCALLASTARAESLRCGNKLIYEGDSTGKVTALCGQPSQVDTSSMNKSASFWRHGQRFDVPGSTDRVKVESWLYNFGTQRLMRRLRFEDGTLVKIETLGYGYSTP